LPIAIQYCWIPEYCYIQILYCNKAMYYDHTIYKYMLINDVRNFHLFVPILHAVQIYHLSSYTSFSSTSNHSVTTSICSWTSRLILFRTFKMSSFASAFTTGVASLDENHTFYPHSEKVCVLRVFLQIWHGSNNCHATHRNTSWRLVLMS
jgi:hypothetical protein